MKLKVGVVLSAESQVAHGQRGTYMLLDRHNRKQWRVLVLEADPGRYELPGETTVINDDWLTEYTEEIG